MKNKSIFLVPALLAGLTCGQCYGGNATIATPAKAPVAAAYNSGSTLNNPSTGVNPNAGSGSLNAPKPSYGYTNPNTTNPNTPNNPVGGSSAQQNCPASGCSTMDFSIFEGNDEEQTYLDHGFTRGDIKNLYTSKYDPKLEATINGNIAKILRVQFPDGNCYLVAVVTTDNGDILANLGPVWFADENNIVVNEGDTVQLLGSKIRTNGRFILLVSQLKKNGQTMNLRSQNGGQQWGSPKSQRGT